LKDQAYCERIGASPLTPLECGKFNLPGYVGFFQFLRNFRQQNAFEQAELILRAALDPSIAGRAKKGEFVMCFDHFDLLQTAINGANSLYHFRMRVVHEA
jgi:hypothetical protein